MCNRLIQSSDIEINRFKAGTQLAVHTYTVLTKDWVLIERN